MDILQMIDLHKIQGMATSPYGLGEFLKYYEADSAFDLNFDHIVCQGAMLSRELSQRARARMCQNLYSSYGATETRPWRFGPASVLESGARSRRLYPAWGNGRSGRQVGRSVAAAA